MKWFRRIAILLVFVAICLYINKNYVIGKLFNNYIHTTLVDDLDSQEYDIEVVKFNKKGGSIVPYFYYERYSSDEYSYHFLNKTEYDLYICNGEVYLQTITNRATALAQTSVVSTALTPDIENEINKLDEDEYAILSETFENSTYTQNSVNTQDNIYTMNLESKDASISTVSYSYNSHEITLKGTTQVCFDTDSSREMINVFFDDDLNDRVYQYDTISSDTEITEQEMIDLINGISENGN